MDIESIRQTDTGTVTHYSIILNPVLTPEYIYRAIAQSVQPEGFTTKAESVSDRVLRISVLHESIPCVEISCRLVKPLSPDFMAFVASLSAEEEEEAASQAPPAGDGTDAELLDGPSLLEPLTPPEKERPPEPETVQEMSADEEMPLPVHYEREDAQHIRERIRPRLEPVPTPTEQTPDALPPTPAPDDAPVLETQDLRDPAAIPAPPPPETEAMEPHMPEVPEVTEEEEDSTETDADDAVTLAPPGDEAPEETREDETAGSPAPEGEPLEGEVSAIETPAKDLRPGKIAIILDDGGYGGAVTTRVLALDNRIALAILPDTPFAQSTAQEAKAKGFDIMLHMPMQTNSENSAHAFPGELTFDMTKKEIQKRTRECIAQFPGIVGVNNHTGAGFTTDEKRIGWFLDVVKEHDLFFVDSRTTWKSKAYDVAVKKKIPAARREIFLDNSSDPEEIRKYLQILVQRARDRGISLGIGHFRINTVAVLEKELPKLKEQNIELVRISEVIQ